MAIAKHTIFPVLKMQSEKVFSTILSVPPNPDIKTRVTGKSQQGRKLNKNRQPRKSLISLSSI